MKKILLICFISLFCFTNINLSLSNVDEEQAIINAVLDDIAQSLEEIVDSESDKRINVGKTQKQEWLVFMVVPDAQNIIKTWAYRDKKLTEFKDNPPPEEVTKVDKGHDTLAKFIPASPEEVTYDRSDKIFPPFIRFHSYYFCIYKDGKDRFVQIRYDWGPLAAGCNLYKVNKDELGNIKLEHLEMLWES